MYFHGEVTVGDLGDDTTDFTEGFLEGFVGLLMLAEFPFEEHDVFVFDLGESAAGVFFLLEQFVTDLSDDILLKADFLGLLLDVIPEVTDVFFAHESSARIRIVPIGVIILLLIVIVVVVVVTIIVVIRTGRRLMPSCAMGVMEIMILMALWRLLLLLLITGWARFKKKKKKNARGGRGKEGN